jgi:endo-1,4-beta-xylanase
VKSLVPVLFAFFPLAVPAGDRVSLHEAFSDVFLIGTAVNAEQIASKDPEFRTFLLRHFNALTGENVMKWERIHPTEGEYNWGPADALTDLANENGIHLTGHTLVWHQQTPDWVFEDADGNPATRELLLERMQHHIAAVVGRYKSRVQSWDVVNEAFEEDGSMRDTPWRRIIGDDYLEKAFEFAHAADPDALLFYNDYNMFAPGRRDAVIRFVESMNNKGIPVHGIGLQGHFRVDYPAQLDSIDTAIERFGRLNVDVAITELDVSVLPWPGEKRGGADIMDRHAFEEQMNPYAEGLSADAQAAFDERYLALFRIFIKHREVLTRVTFWGINDSVSWRNDWPMTGRTDYPLLIDRNNRLKPVWADIIALLD